ncbi:aromatic amino acid DMT transporter YddG [uncultured Mailhella sp.]|uniref:aromatic amino acid DMT transporter YddG n=1 Tax=uncultured Mailhella sp. TaxID=1981031 RepID=UPI00260FA1D5|nr:aromatic amino acid DMT transporter YddG [uncultured Mailhella sp.]
MRLDSACKATLIGLLAPLCWGMSVGLTRSITESFGLAAGISLLSWAVCLYLTFFLGLPKLSAFPRKYLLLGLPMANVCSLCFCSSLYLSDGGAQTVEVGMVNYLWPCLVVLFAVVFNGQKARWWMAPGVIISFLGVMLVLGGKEGIQPDLIWTHVRQNPWSYLMAFLGAMAWAVYSNLTRAWSRGQNPTVIVFALDALIFTGAWLLGFGDLGHASVRGWLSLGLGTVAMGSAYAAWSYGVTRGSITLLGVASYFTPVLSCLFAVVWIDASLDASFWLGVLVVVCGSLLCWSSTVLHR